MLVEETPMPQGEFFSNMATDGSEYQRVVEKLTALQLWIRQELDRMQMAETGQTDFASVVETPR
jgi:hypothetical protein